MTVEGEVSNCKFNRNGNIYFSLKDENSKINCIMFKWAIKERKIELEDGMNVKVKCSVSLYEKDGSVQLIVSEIEKEGSGKLFEEYLKLKEKLENEGYFDETHKVCLPKLPEKIGIVTSPTSAAVRDMISVAKRRFSGIEILIYPASTQGEAAAAEIIEGIKYFEKEENVDIIVIGRGGGAYEDLNCFNSEDIVKQLYKTKTPTISAVGHQTDYVLTDFAADKRAPTPSAAMEIAIPNSEEIKEYLDGNLRTCKKRIISNLNFYKNRFNSSKISLDYLNPLKKIQSNRELLEELFNKSKYYIKYKYNNNNERLNKYDNFKDIIFNRIAIESERVNGFKNINKLIYKTLEIDRYFETLEKVMHDANNAISRRINLEKDIIDTLKLKINLLDPNYLLERGYSYTTDEFGNLIDNVENVETNQDIITVLKNGEIYSRIYKKRCK